MSRISDAGRAIASAPRTPGSGFQVPELALPSPLRVAAPPSSGGRTGEGGLAASDSLLLALLAGRSGSTAALATNPSTVTPTFHRVSGVPLSARVEGRARDVVAVADNGFGSLGSLSAREPVGASVGDATRAGPEGGTGSVLTIGRTHGWREGAGAGASPAVAATEAMRPTFVRDAEVQLRRDLAEIGLHRGDGSVGVDGSDGGSALEPTLAARGGPVLQAYRRVFGRLVDGYRPLSSLLGAIKAAYEARVHWLEEQVEVAPALAARLAVSRQSLAEKVQRVRDEAGVQVSGAQTRAEALQREVDRLRDELGRTRERLADATVEVETLRVKVEDVKTSNSTLVAAYRRGEVSAREAVRREAERSQEVVELKRLATSATADAERWQRELTLLKSRVRHMLPAQEVARRDQKFQDLRAELESVREELERLRVENQRMLAEQQKRLGSSSVLPVPSEWIALLAGELDVPLVPAPARKAGEAEEKEAKKEDKALSAFGFDFVSFSSMIRRIQLLKKSLTSAAVGEDDGLGERAGGGGARRAGDAESGPRRPTFAGEEGTGEAGARTSILDAAKRAEMDDAVDSTTALPGFDGRWMPGADPLFQRGMAPAPLSTAIFAPRFFVGRGTGPEVPRFLRAHGQIRHRDLNKRATERLVKACWIAKQEAEDSLRRRRGAASRVSGMPSEDAGVDVRIPLQDFLFTFLVEKYGSPGMAVEWAYNFVYALQRFAYDSDIEVFLRVLQGRLPEEVHTRGIIMLNELYTSLETLDRSMSGGRATGKVHREDLVAHVREAYATKTPESMAALLAALATDRNAQTEMIEYRALLSEDENGDQGDFVECLRDQHLVEFQEYVAELVAMTTRLATGPPEERFVTIASAADAIRRVDPEKPDEDVLRLVARGVHLPPTRISLTSTMAVPLQPYLDRLRAGWLQRSTRRCRDLGLGPADEPSGTTGKASTKGGAAGGGGASGTWKGGFVASSSVASTGTTPAPTMTSPGASHVERSSVASTGFSPHRRLAGGGTTTGMTG